MALPIRWLPKATRQLEANIAYIAEDSPRYAAIFTIREMQTIRAIPERPHTGHMVPNAGELGISRVCISRFSGKEKH